MSRGFVKLHDVTFCYESAANFLFENISFHLAESWTGVAGANGTGKTTLLKLITGNLTPVSGAIDVPEHAIYCQQRTDDPPKRFDDFLFTSSKKASILKDQLAIEDDWYYRWETLSHGERKRVQLGVALWQEPDLLAIDEPTNHLDSYARALILRALQEYGGVGIIVSHDRDLLDTLCHRCIFINPPDVIIRPGGITQVMATIQQEQHAVQKQYKLKKRALKKLHRETSRRKQEAQQADARRSKRGLAKKDHDARQRIDTARVTGKDGHAGKLQRQLQGRLDQLQSEFDDTKVQKEYTLGIWLPGSASKRNFLLHLPAGNLPLGEKKQLDFPTLSISPQDKIAFSGPNGAGKSTLIRHLLHHLNADAEHITYVPQEIDLRNSKQILEQATALTGEKLGHLMNIVSRLNSRPDRLLQSTEPSPGEIRKLLLALGMVREPHIIIMDEPTNHLDLPSIECLENALADCPCALILVSHDEYFLRNLTTIHWHFSVIDKGKRQLKVE